MPAIQEAAPRGLDIGVLARSYSRLFRAPNPSPDVVTVRDINGNMVCFYKTIDEYIKVQTHHMSRRDVDENDFQRQEGYSINEFIPDGHVPAYNGHKIVFRQLFDAMGCLVFHNSCRSVEIGFFTRENINYLLKQDIPISLE